MLTVLAATTAQNGFQGINVYFLAALAGVLIAAFTFWEWLKRRHKSFVSECVEDALDDSLDELVKTLTERLTFVIHDQVEVAYHRLKDVLDALDRRVTIMETKVDVFWQKVAHDMASVLHHPEQSRQYLDQLLDALMDGNLTNAQYRELRKYLETIRDWEPGDPAPFIVYQGEQVAAVILLHAINYLTDTDSYKGAVSA